MALSVVDLFKTATEDEILETFLSTLETLKIPARSWRKGGVYRTILRTVARSYSGFTDVMAAFAKSGFLDDAEAGWLTLLARMVYGVERRPGTYATGKVLFTNTGGGVYNGPSYAAGTVRPIWTIGKKTYETLDDLNLTAPGQTQLVAVRAIDLGSSSSAPPGQIDKLETTLLGVTVTNPAAVVGSDEQADESLRQTCRDKLAALSLLGPRGAYAYAVDAARRNDGSPVDINRYRVVPNEITGVVTVYCASPAGVPVADDLDAVRASVELWARPDSVTAVVAAASTAPFAKSLTVWAKAAAGVDATTLQEAVLAALIKLTASYPIGGLKKPPSTQGYLFATNIEGVVEGADPSIYAVDGVGADLALGPGEVATLAATVTVRIVP